MELVDLKNVIVPSARVKVNDTQEIEVFGVDLQSLLTIFRNDLDQLDRLIEGDTDIEQLLKDLPQVCNSILLAGTRSPEDARKVVSKLPTQVHLSALVEIFRLTFPDMEALKKLVGGLATNIKALTTEAQKIRSGAQSPKQ